METFERIAYIGGNIHDMAKTAITKLGVIKSCRVVTSYGENCAVIAELRRQGIETKAHILEFYSSMIFVGCPYHLYPAVEVLMNFFKGPIILIDKGLPLFSPMIRRSLTHVAWFDVPVETHAISRVKDWNMKGGEHLGQRIAETCQHPDVHYVLVQLGVTLGLQSEKTDFAVPIFLRTDGDTQTSIETSKLTPIETQLRD